MQAHLPLPMLPRSQLFVTQDQCSIATVIINGLPMPSSTQRKIHCALRSQGQIAQKHQSNVFSASNMVEWQLDVESLPERPLTHIQENYSCLYQPGDGGNDLLFRLHPNGLCLVGLAPSHPALQAVAAGDGSGSQPSAPEPATGSDPNDGGQSAVGGIGDEQQQGAAPPAASSQEQQPGCSDALLHVAQKLLQAEFRKGRGPLLQPETILGRRACGMAGKGLRLPLAV